ncbi:MAG: hypothetical protein OEY89_11695 [Gammaproteobacteria bacterium]|nr:hypothetical protein [Gammaproteobacteria bacterium]
MKIFKSIKDLLYSKSVVDDDTKKWIFDTYAWALKSFGSDIFYDDTVLVLPTNDYFPDNSSDPSELALLIFERVKKLAGMDEWDCDLVAQDPDVDPVISPAIVINNAPKGPAGSFKLEGNDNRVVITYNPDLIKKPEELIATFAHELSHYLSAVASELPPGGEEAWEPATDLIAVFIGFGVFLANSAFTYESYSSIDAQGWSARSQGYSKKVPEGLFFDQYALSI